MLILKNFRFVQVASRDDFEKVLRTFVSIRSVTALSDFKFEIDWIGEKFIIHAGDYLIVDKWKSERIEYCCEEEFAAKYKVTPDGLLVDKWLTAIHLESIMDCDKILQTFTHVWSAGMVSEESVADAEVLKFHLHIQGSRELLLHMGDYIVGGSTNDYISGVSDKVFDLIFGFYDPEN